MRCLKNSDSAKVIFNACSIWLGGWFIFVMIELMLKFAKNLPIWPPMMLATLFCYLGAAIAVGVTIGGTVSILLIVVRRWQPGIETTPLMMSCCITITILLYTALFVYGQFLPLYPQLPPVLVNLALIIAGLILLGIFYRIFTRTVDKTRLTALYLAWSLSLYTLMIASLYINENVLSGNFLDPDVVRITTNIGILTGSVLLFVITCRIFNVISSRAGAMRKFIPLKALAVIAILLLTSVGVTLYIRMYPPLRKAMVTPGKQTADRPNIILITMDTTRADHLSCYGYHKNTTPHLDNFARENVMFTNAYATAPWTLPSHASIFTSLYPARHGAHFDRKNFNCDWPKSLSAHNTTLAEILADHGYMTAGIIGGVFCKTIFGLAQGFEHYDDALINVLPDLEHFVLFKILHRWLPLNETAFRWGISGCRVACQINTRVFSWLEKHSQSPFFLFINYFDPHGPYLPPDKYSLLFREEEDPKITGSERDKRDLLTRYDGEIAYLDDQIAKLFEKLKELNIYDTSMIIITSDHGEFFGDHGFTGHAHELYEEIIKIPLIIKYPSASSKKGVYLNRVSLVDIMPTILDFLKLPLPENIQGANLFAGSNKVMAEIYQHEHKTPQKGEKYARELKALFLNNYKYIKEFTEESKYQEELYDVENDPQELNNLIDTMYVKANEMEMKLMEWLPHDEFPKSTQKPVKFDKSTEENLRALGYIP